MDQTCFRSWEPLKKIDHGIEITRLPRWQHMFFLRGYNGHRSVSLEVLQSVVSGIPVCILRPAIGGSGQGQAMLESSPKRRPNIGGLNLMLMGFNGF